MKFVVYCFRYVFGEPSAVAVGFRAIRGFGPRDINERVDLGWCVGLDLGGEGGVEMLGQGD